jgi:uncharacterized MAPEG superfamily protein
MTIALWCVLIAAILPLVSVGVAKATGGRYDNRDPRGQAQGYTGLAKRAYAAQQNAFEAFPFFAAAVLVAEVKGGPASAVSLLAIAFVVLRAGYLAFYLTDKPTQRSVVWALAYFACAGIFISPLWR